MAANLEIYKQVKSLAIPTSTFEDIQGTPAIPKGLPFKEGHIPAFSIVSVNGNISEDQEGILHDRLVKLSPIHGRSYEVRFGETNRMYWSDEYENIYSTLTTKGNNLDYPKAFKNPVSPSGFLVYGLQDSDSMVRVLKSSDMLRSHNIETEIIVRVMQPEELPMGDQLIPLDEFKKTLLQGVWKDNAENDSVDQVGLAKITREEVPTLATALDKMTFFITVRGHQVSERLQDLIQPETKEEFQMILNRVFDYVNKVEEIKAKRDSNYNPQVFDSTKDDDIKRYLTEYLPQRIAVNFAKLHNLGLIHFFPHSGNISAVGSLYDLDSVRGEPLGIGDEPITDEDITKDIRFIIHGQGTSSDGVLGMLDGVQQKRFLPTELDLKTKFEHSFYREYIAQRGWEDDVIGNLDKIYSFFDKFRSYEFRNNMLVYYLSKISDQLGWDYPYPQYTSNLEEAYVQQLRESRQDRFRRIKEDIPYEQKEAEDRERFHNDNASGIESHRYGSAVFKVLEEDLRSKFSSELEIVTQTYGQEIADMIVSMHILRHNEKVYAELKAERHEGVEEENEHYYQAIKAEGWENDIIQYLGEIYDSFENFANNGDQEYLDRYLSILKTQTGIDFPFEDSDIEPVFEAYIYRAKEDLERVLKKAIENAAPDEALHAVVAKAYLEAGYSQDAEFSWDNWSVFALEHISWIVQERCNEQIELSLKSRFDQEEDRDMARGDIYLFLSAKAVRKLEDALTDEKEKELLSKENQMELQTMAQFISPFQPIPSES